jgi:hypothetical protein
VSLVERLAGNGADSRTPVWSLSSILAFDLLHTDRADQAGRIEYGSIDLYLLGVEQIRNPINQLLLNLVNLGALGGHFVVW